MKKRLSDFEHELLKKIEKLFLELSHNTTESSPLFAEASLFQLKTLLGQLGFSNDEELKKCSSLADHLYPEMSLRHFLNLLIPIERALGRNLKDSDFLVTSTDGNHATRVLPANRPLYFILENLRSSFNVGSILRLADGLGVKAVYLCGYTPGPESDGVKKTGLGADEKLSVERFDRTSLAIDHLRRAGEPIDTGPIEIIGLETAKTAHSLFAHSFQKSTALIVGNERFGLDAETLKHCDALVELPLVGFKNSLNVATALAGAAFEWTRQNQKA